MSDATYRLYYWPGLPGRGEFVRLAFEDAGVPYLDMARLPEAEGGGVAAMQRLLQKNDAAVPPFAPPFLVHEGHTLAQVGNILHYLGPRLGLAPSEESGRAQALQLQLTLADFVAEIHDTHHPLSTAFYYEEQREAAHQRAAAFLRHRLPKFMGYFEQILAGRGEGEYLLGPACGYVDLSLFQVCAGLAYAFPKNFAAVEGKYPRVLALAARVAARPRLAAYLASPRRLAFNEHGLFRRYPELDQLPT